MSSDFPSRRTYGHNVTFQVRSIYNTWYALQFSFYDIAAEEHLAGRQPIVFVPGSTRDPRGVKRVTSELERTIIASLSDLDICALTFNYPGVGLSAGNQQTQSIAALSDSTSDLVGHWSSRFDNPVILVAFSMGGHVASVLPRVVEVSQAILAWPAAYPLESEAFLFGPDFSSAIRRQGNWINSPALDRWSGFQGKLSVIYGEHDQVIPKELQSTYFALSDRSGVSALLPDFAHSLSVAPPRGRGRATALLTALLRSAVMESASAPTE